VAQGVDQAPSGRQLGAQFPAATVAGGFQVFQRDRGGGRFGQPSGRRMAKGICPACGTKMNRILGTA
jgi:hypothetical protein